MGKLVSRRPSPERLAVAAVTGIARRHACADPIDVEAHWRRSAPCPRFCRPGWRRGPVSCSATTTRRWTEAPGSSKWTTDRSRGGPVPAPSLDPRGRRPAGDAASRGARADRHLGPTRTTKSVKPRPAYNHQTEYDGLDHGSVVQPLSEVSRPIAPRQRPSNCRVRM